MTYVYPMWNKSRQRRIDRSKVGQSVGEETCKAFMDFLHSPAATSSAPIVARAYQCSKAGY